MMIRLRKIKNRGGADTKHNFVDIALLLFLYAQTFGPIKGVHSLLYRGHLI